MRGRRVGALGLALGVLLTAQARTRIDFNSGWMFSRDGKGFAAVRVPHDWAIEGLFNPKGDGNTGKLPWKGHGVYRKQLVLGANPKGRVFIDFDGVMSRATVFVNDNACGKGEYGYLGFRADATPFLTSGTNEVVVRCDTLDHASRWYPGAGIYRNVWLVKTDDVYIEDDSLRFETRCAGENWFVTVSGRIVSRREAKTRVVVRADLQEIGGASAVVEVDGFNSEEFELKFGVKSPRLWQIEDRPALYRLLMTAKGEDGSSDALERRVGFREFEFDANKGFMLNGRRVQLKGVNLHSDLGPLGMAFNKDAMRRQLTIMKDMGANALRTSHNCPAPEVLDLCDEMGLFVWNECFDKWNQTCGRGNEPLEPFVARTLRAWVRRDRLHPSVFCWSIGNEISTGKATPPGQSDWWTGADGTSVERCARFRNAVRKEDLSRPCCIGSCFPDAVLRGDYAPLDLTGWNYNQQYRKMKDKYPEKPVLYTESASALSEFGYYASELPKGKTDFAESVFHVDSRDFNASEWSDIPDREFFRMERDRFCGGEFVWTGIDYLGEPTPYADSRSSYFGICDLCALPKDRFYLYRSQWNGRSPTLHIVPHHWNFPEKAGKTMPVFVYTNFDEAELFVNGRSQGRRRKDSSAGSLEDYYSCLPRYRLMWMNVAYVAGEVKVIAYGPDGRPEMEQVLRTAAEPVRVVLTPEKAYGDLRVVIVTLADKDGNFIPNDNRCIFFEAEGCEILAVGNSDPRGMECFKATKSHSLCFGRAAVYLRGDGVLTASAEGLESARTPDDGARKAR